MGSTLDSKGGTSARATEQAASRPIAKCGARVAIDSRLLQSRRDFGCRISDFGLPQRERCVSVDGAHIGASLIGPDDVFRHSGLRALGRITLGHAAEVFHREAE